MNLKEIQVMITETANSHGWGDGPADIPAACALFHSEVSELFEHYRNGQDVNEIFYGNDDKPDGIPVEVADIIIRVLHFAEYHGIDVEKAILIKNQYNMARPFKHGNKVI